MTASLRRPATAGVLVALVLVLGWWQLLWNPQSAALAAAHQQEQEQTTGLYQAGQTLGHLKHLQIISGRLAAMEHQVSAAVPATDDLDQFLLSLNALAQSDGVTLANVWPGPPSVSAGMSTIQIEVSVVGGYGDVERFLEGMRKGSRLVVVDSLTEAPTTTGGAAGTVSATVDIHLLSGLAATPAAAAASGGGR